MSLFQFYEEENTREESLNNYKYLFTQFEKITNFIGSFISNVYFIWIK